MKKNLNKGLRQAARCPRGFTLIELMITITIVAILVALAVPAYRNYTVRSKIAECINSAAIPRVHVSEYRQTLGAWPPSAEAAAIDAPIGASHFCLGFSNYLPTDGSFFVDVDESEVDDILSSIEPRMVPTLLPSNSIDWNCLVGNTHTNDIKYLPATCRDSS